MTSFLISMGEIPISTEEVRQAIGLRSRALDGLIAAAIARHAIDSEIVPAIWDEPAAATEQQIAKGHNPLVIGDSENGQKIVSYSPNERQIYICKQKIVVWLLQQDDVLNARAEEVRARLAETTISLSPEF